MSLIVAAAAFGQPLTFEVASAKPSTPPDYTTAIYRTIRGGPGTADPGRWSCDHVALSDLLRTAYNLQAFQFAGLPWMDDRYVAIVAKVPPDATRDDLRTMLQTLLVERFQIKSRRERKEVAGYELVVTKNGPKLRESPPLAEGETEIPAPPKERPRVTLGADGYPSIPPGLAVTMTLGFRARRQAIRESMDALARNLSAQIGKPVVDATGLRGKYDFTVSWIYDGRGVPPLPPPGSDRPASPAGDPNGPTIFSAVQEQLGLRLEPKKVLVDFLTVERAERTPIEN